MHSLTEWEQSCCNIVRYYLRAGNIISDALTDESCHAQFAVKKTE